MSLEILASTSHVLATQMMASENLFPVKVWNEAKVESTKFQCSYPKCARGFTSKRNLVDHYRGHHQGSKPHTCTYQGCGKSFLRPAHLLIHTRIHTGEKPFICTYEGCGKRWNQKSALKQHMRSHTGEKPFECTVSGCYKKFSTSSSCKRHILTHTKSSDTPQNSPPGSPLSPTTQRRNNASPEMWVGEQQKVNASPLDIRIESIPITPKVDHMSVQFLLN